MSRQILDLSTLPWRFGQVARQPFSPMPQDDRGAVRDWLPARVPGDIRADLIAAGRIPPVETPAGIAAGAWVDDYDGWYVTELAGGDTVDAQVILEADGIDYYSAVWLDDQLLVTHAGMFSRQVIPLSPWINAAGPHQLAIRVWGGGALPHLPNPLPRRAARWLIGKLSPGAEYFPDRMAVPKAQFSFGWDFAPRLLSAGIWDEIKLVSTHGAYIENLWARVEPLKEDADPTPATWRLRLRVTRWQSGPVQVEIVLQPENFTGSGYGSLRRTVTLCDDEAPVCTADYAFDLEMAAVRRWWPWDQGEPCLYRVTVRLLAPRPAQPAGEGRGLDEISQVVGVRSVTKATLPGGAPWRWVINERDVFLRGANWAPVDSLPGRVTAADYGRLLRQARDAGINFLRVWGGGVREKQAFWDECDRLGIMAWQEFPLACAFFDHYPRNPNYLDVLAAEVRSTAWALRHHPSLIAWCGGNEINPGREQLPLRAIAGVLAVEDPARPFIPASPSEADIHFWNVWHRFAPWSRLAAVRAPFLSEFGLQSLPHAATVAEMFPGTPAPPLSDPSWGLRKAQVAKLRHYAGPAAAADLASAIAATQRSQATALQVGIEACRLRRITNTPELAAAGSPCGGVAFWQFNEPWPAVSWSVMDRAGRPKAAYDMLRRSFQPLLLAAIFPWQRYGPGDTFQAEIWLVNDGPQSWPDGRAEAILDGQLIWSQDGLAVAPAAAWPIESFTHMLTASPQRLELRLIHAGAVLAANSYDLAVYLPGPQPLRGRVLRWLADRLVGP